jgi:hypothetical protein
MNLIPKSFRYISDKYPVHQIFLSDNESKSMDLTRFHGEKLYGDSYRLWDFGEILNLLSDSFSREIKEAFNTLVPYAYKADLARYCILYQYGGFYLDLGVSNFKPFPVLDNDLIAFSDGFDGESSWNVSNGLIYANPKIGILENCIIQVVQNSKSDYYGKTPLWPTGPGLFGREIARSVGDFRIELGNYDWHYYRRNRFVLPRVGCVAKGKRRVLSKNNLLRNFSRGIPGGNDYTSLWKDRQIYEFKEKSA